MLYSSFLSLALLASNCEGWGLDGHREAARIAANRVSRKTARFVRDHIHDRAKRYRMTHIEYALVSNAGWADFHAMHENPATAALHFSHTPYRDCQPYKFSRDCGEDGSGECIVKAIADFAQIASDYSKSEIERANAIRFLVHLLADIHNPMHVGFAEDLGGNRIELFLPDGTESVLHLVWDDHVLVNPDLAKDYTETDLSKFHISEVDSMDPKFAELIASETATTLTCKHAYWNGSQWIRKGDRLTEQYMETRSRQAWTQIAKSGVRLAQILEAVASEYYKQEAATEYERETKKAKKRPGSPSNPFEVLMTVEIDVDPEDLVYEVVDVLAVPDEEEDDVSVSQVTTAPSPIPSGLAVTTHLPEDEFDSDDITTTLTPEEKKRAKKLRMKHNRTEAKKRVTEAMSSVVLIKRSHKYFIVSQSRVESDEWIPSCVANIIFSFRGCNIAAFIDSEVFRITPGATQKAKIAQIISQVTREPLEAVEHRMSDPAGREGLVKDGFDGALAALVSYTNSRIKFGLSAYDALTEESVMKIPDARVLASNFKGIPAAKREAQYAMDYLRARVPQMIMLYQGREQFVSTAELMATGRDKDRFLLSSISIIVGMEGSGDPVYVTLFLDSRLYDGPLNKEIIQLLHGAGNNAQVFRNTRAVLKKKSHPLMHAFVAFSIFMQAQRSNIDAMAPGSEFCVALLLEMNAVVRRGQPDLGMSTFELVFRPPSQRDIVNARIEAVMRNGL
jgi:hypothetical protein